MAFTAADVGPRIDVLIDGQGYVFDDSIDPSSVYSSRQRAQFGLSPIFVQRQNVSGDYGDAQQDFFLTFTQRDWSEGEQQRYFRQADDDSKRRYWAGSSIDPVRIAGQVSLRRDLVAFTAGAAIDACTSMGNRGVFGGGAANLYKYGSPGGSETSLGAHGLGTQPSTYGMATDGRNVFLSGTNAGTVGVRRFNADTSAFTTFSATPADSLAFLGNTLYGYRSDTGDFIRYDAAGVATTLFTWKDAAGAAVKTTAILRPFGGKLLILLDRANFVNAQLWIYDGSGTSKLMDLPLDFTISDVAIVAGTVFMGGYVGSDNSAQIRPVIYYYANGTTGLLWQARDYGGSTTVGPALAAFEGGLVFNDEQAGRLMFYDIANGGVHSGGAITSTAALKVIAAGTDFFVLFTTNSTSSYRYARNGARASAATVTTSLVDFDSSLSKNFHGVRVEFDAATDGDGGSVDIAYRVGDVDGSYTSAATGVTSGSEILFSGVSGKSISIKVTLNKGTSTSGPVLKRISLRASPIQPQYALARYTLALYGTDKAAEPENRRVKLRDDTYHPKSGKTMLSELRASAAKTTPISITDEVRGTFNAIVNPEDMAIDRIRVGEYRVQLTVREV